MMTTFSAIVHATPGLAVLEHTSRLLLTIGVGLFLAYLVLIIAANIVGFLHRLITQTSQRQRPTASSPRSAAHASRVPVAAGTRVLERDAL